ncbi:Beta-1,4-galactosyltransferase 7 [Hypsibius exemplaris]|uniref:Beta-1,4-N-acetylgalactosaminyltransferase n=1 Tax=Hypsibius exemplaris TaxID=2072580 RepID=A0A1W0WPY7_HYPEX|nr:Beta-1,4-galactosyltransferase 7 [Hypsibius exemplaris]
MSLIFQLFQVLRYHARRLRTYPLGVIFAAGLIVLFIFFIVLWILSHLLAAFSLTSNGVENHHLAVIVPFRDRFDELLQFIPHITAFLTAQQIRHHIFVVNQADEFRFNRASLINVGFTLVRDQFDYIAMHDVDLLPDNPALDYGFPAAGPMHLAAPDLHPRYHYTKFIGGILLMTNTQFQKVDGMSNKYWGWGMEDDELAVRLKEAHLNISRPTGITTGYKTFKHVHSDIRRKRDMEKLPGQKESNRRRDRETGLRNVLYELLSEHRLSVDGTAVTVFNVKLQCDLQRTPWCLPQTPQPPQSRPTTQKAS